MDVGRVQYIPRNPPYYLVSFLTAEIIVPSFYNEARLGFRYNAETRAVKFRCRKSFIIPSPFLSLVAEYSLRELAARQWKKK